MKNQAMHHSTIKERKYCLLNTLVKIVKDLREQNEDSNASLYAYKARDSWFHAVSN